ncbi:MAG: ribosome silencing factor [Clostridiaceae bacterium]|jgi:ribosome-associated protein|nr:ribosome silencing factor [Clostridia bacterium]MBP6162298.1 ribosome silencing factor [Clostridia bacterium]MBP6949500.1 ribosome silencing factor [Clostridia bacterium]NMA36449.1 ribosome silencing factor [Clostridiaceae bacterium]
MKLEEIDCFASVAVDALEEKKAVDVEVLKVTTKTTLADVFVVATGTSNTHIKTLADSVEEKLKEIHNLTPHHIEGLEARSWVLLDYGDLVVHLMLEEDRMFYNLESLWRLGTQHP